MTLTAGGPELRPASTGLQQIALDALWYIDPDAGIDGVWDNALAAEKPIYNEDFTQMTVKLRPGLYWSDGVEFTADDLYYTVDVQMKTPGFNSTGTFNGNVEKMEMPDKYTVVFTLKEPNSRFHAFFTVRWGAVFMMPKHIFEKEADPLAFKFNPPVSLSAYTLKDFDPNGSWYLWQRREDWQKTSLGRFGEPGPKYAMYIDPGPSDKRVIAQMQHDLDVIHDITPEGRITLAKNSPSSVGWFQSFPWAHPDPTLPAVIYNNEMPGLDKKEVRWALTLAIDIVRVAMASYRGAATISAIHVPPTGMYPQYYFDPLEGWLNDFTIDVGGTPYKAFDPEACNRIAEEARKTLGDLVPTDPAEIKKSIGGGWWKYDVKAAEQLMLDAGMKRDGSGTWQLPDGSPFKVPMMSMNETNPTMNRCASMVVECWKEFGIDTLLDSQAAPWPIMQRVTTAPTWPGRLRPGVGILTCPSSSRPGTRSSTNRAANNQRAATTCAGRTLSSTRSLRSIQKVSFDDPKAIELGQQFIKLAAAEMPITPLMAYNVFTVCDTTYWQGFPTAEDPYTDPVPNWANTKYMYVKVKPQEA